MKTKIFLPVEISFEDDGQDLCIYLKNKRYIIRRSIDMYEKSMMLIPNEEIVFEIKQIISNGFIKILDKEIPNFQETSS